MTQSIPASAIVSVTPSVLAAGGQGLDLVGLMLTTSYRVPIGSVQSFGNAGDVEDFFGAASDEAAAANIYFLGFNNSTVKPGSVLFAQYPSVAVAAWLQGGPISALTLAQLQAISGSLTVLIDGYSRTGAAINLSGAVSFSAAAGLIQTGLNGALATIASFTASIATTTLTVSAMTSGTIAVGQTVKGAGVAAGTIITALGTGTGGIGTYIINNSQTVASEAMTTEPTPVVVTYDSVAGAFLITSGITGVPSTSDYATGTIADDLKLQLAQGATKSQGAAAAVPGTFMDGITVNTQAWASFMTIFDPDTSGNANKLLFAAWNNLQNNRYTYVVWDTDTTPTASNPATGSLGYLIKQADYSGSCVIYTPNTPKFSKAAFICGAIASLNFEETNGRATMAFRSQTGLVADVISESVGDNLIANGYNFYGSYATAAQEFTFFYPGSVSGPFLWLDSYVDQIWLNNFFQSALMSLLTNVKSIPYNSAGYGLIEAACLDPINAGLNFGAFRPGITLSAVQIAAVNNAANRNIAPTLQTRGWYLLVQDASPAVRAARGSPPCTFFYVDGQSVQKIELASIMLQ